MENCLKTMSGPGARGLLHTHVCAPPKLTLYSSFLTVDGHMSVGLYNLLLHLQFWLILFHGSEFCKFTTYWENELLFLFV